ncbi:dTDP-4-dehydrorhamnose 3,5-epimerase [Robertkochia marina]|uniref:dTDP-4-dehydrorhamnose 3,5-epimerase n=1 Tax=Robertkochia marina TaxID=1227945 RepID=A0A4V6RRU2_9FLAO|nr:dTDP-4-dehydrorhamnose 3,5-epimerase [Robertkochia marina]THD69338.1 dTDP-4-dehydrorhamnose 3,5-epimerase [Robertkochia marina]TRZ47401.1 dTDP-4-dehydrorhamnose 3,5-epimerase [Robertkochia marina]
MEVEKTEIEGCFLIKPKRFYDERGSFSEGYNKARYEKMLGRSLNFCQDNLSYSVKGVLRGLHFQRSPHAQAKLVQVIKGKVQDVVVDLRPESPTFKKYVSVVLSEENGYQLFVPKGMAHGFLALTDEVVFQYKCDAYYQPEAEAGIMYNDPELSIPWMMNEKELILSGKDKELPVLNQFLHEEQ